MNKFHIGQMIVGNLVWQQEEAQKEDISTALMAQEALQGHSGGNLIDPTLQDNVVIEEGTFTYIYHVGSAFSLHSIISNGLIPGGQETN